MFVCGQLGSLKACDVFALGVTLYEMASMKKLPSHGRPYQVIIHQHITYPHTRPSSTNT